MRNTMNRNNMMTSHRRLISPVPRRMAGLSLVELMVGIALGLIILAGIVAVFANTSRARIEIERSARQVENGRYAVDILTDDLRLAGFYGELKVGAITAPGALPDPCSTAAADWAAAIPLHLQGYDNGAGAPACLPSVKADTDIVVVRRALGCVAGVAGCAAVAANTPYLQVSLCNTLPPEPLYVLALQGAAFLLHSKDCTAVAGLRQYVVRIYFVSTDNGAGQNIPTLKRMELTETGWTETPLVEGVESLNIEYGIDTTGDGTADVYTTDPTAYTCGGPCTPVSNWTNAVTAHFHILVRNTDTSPGQTDTKTYNLGNDAAGNAIVLGPFNDGYRRHVYSGLVRIANPAGRRDTP